MRAAAAYMMEEMRIMLNSAQLKAETWAELGNSLGWTRWNWRTVWTLDNMPNAHVGHQLHSGGICSKHCEVGDHWLQGL